MSNEAKIPHNQSDWKTIDIFLFNNGQEELTPPRKYHLQSEELNWWNATLKSIAKSQYGSLYSMIDLYTVKGEKIENPLRLSNGAAYVAVKPKDSFVDTGYEKYLIKASRSWEKSQARRNGLSEKQTEEINVLIVFPDNNILDNLCEEQIIDWVENAKRIKDDKYATKVCTQQSKIRNSLKNIKNCTNSAKSNQNKIIMNLKRENPASRSLAKNNNSANNTRDVLNILRRNSKLPVRSSERGSMLANCNKSRGDKLKANENLDQNKAIKVPTINHVSTKDKTTSTTQLMNISDKSLMTDHTLQNEEYNNGKDKMENFNNIKDKQIPSGHAVDKEENIQHHKTTIEKSGNLETSNGQSYKKLNAELKSSNSSIVRESVITKYKFNIESVNTDSEPNNELVNKDSRGNLESLERRCLSKNPITVIERESQTNLNAIIFQDTPKQGYMNVEKLLTEQNSHFIVCEYVLAVPQNSNACFCGNNKKYIILLPKNKNITEYQSKISEESQQTTPTKNSAQNINNLKNYEVHFPKINITEPEKKDISTEGTQVTEQNNKSSVPVDNEIPFNDTTLTDEHIFQSIHSTQTEWCGVLLERKSHEDGRYSLHFPALDVLKRLTNKTERLY